MKSYLKSLMAISTLLLSFSVLGEGELTENHQNSLNLDEIATDFLTPAQQSLVTKLMRQGYTEKDALKQALRIDAGREIDKQWERVQEADKYKREQYFRTQKH